MNSMTKFKPSARRARVAAIVGGLMLGIGLAAGFSTLPVASATEAPATTEPAVSHFTVFAEEGRFAAWPANGGMWAWGDDILVCFNEAAHRDGGGHTYDGSTSRNMLARSTDGGETWTIEDAYKQGITAQAMNNMLGDKAVPPQPLTKPIDFTHPDFALLFQRMSNNRGPAHFYVTSDRGQSWQGAFHFPDLDPAGITNRTDYIVDGKHAMTAFLSIGHGRTGVARTTDGGQNWELVSYIGPDFTRSPGYSLMPSTVRLSPQRILTVIRHREKNRVWLTSYRSDDDAKTWTRLDDPSSDNMNTPPALVRLADGRLAMVYVFRRNGDGGSSVCARISSDEGQSWSDELVLRGDDGANWDVGYPRAVQRADGKLVITYYWNHSLNKDKPRYRYIAATIWDPGHE